MSARRSWNPEEVRALGTRTDLVTACQIVYGVSKNTAWRMLRGGELDFPTLKCGRRVVVPVASILTLLALAEPSEAPTTPRTTSPSRPTAVA